MLGGKEPIDLRNTVKDSEKIQPAKNYEVFLKLTQPI